MNKELTALALLALVQSTMVQAADTAVKTYKPIQQGFNASAQGISPIAIGTNAQTNGNSSLSIGSNASTVGYGSLAVGMQAEVTAQLSTVVGAHSKATSGTSSAFGSGAYAGDRFATALGYSAKAIHTHSVAIGSLSVTNSVVNTSQATVNGYTYGTFAGNTAVGTVSVSADKMKRTVTNVAAGRINSASTDAVNGSQLYAVAEQVGKNSKNIANNAAAISHNTDRINSLVNDVGQLNNGLLQLAEAKQQMQQHIHNVERESRAGVAGAIAMANIPQAHKEGQFAVGVGAGYFKGQSAAALGASYITQGGKLVLKGSAFTHTGKRDNYGFGIGAAWTFGGRDVVQPVILEREVIVREVQPDSGKKVRG